MIDDEKIVEAIRAAADREGTVGATARMAADELRDHPAADVEAEVRRLERVGLLNGEQDPRNGSRWYTAAEDDEADRRTSVADAYDGMESFDA